MIPPKQLPPSGYVRSSAHTLDNFRERLKGYAAKTMSGSTEGRAVDLTSRGAAAADGLSRRLRKPAAGIEPGPLTRIGQPIAWGKES
jgi:hypothetical protein